MKWFDTLRIQNQAAQNGTIFSSSLNAIPQGVGESERTGRKCTVKQLTIRFHLNANSAVLPGATGDLYRIIVYLDKQTNGAAATAPLILEGNGGAVNLLSFRNLENTARFWTLYDKTHKISSPGGVGEFNASVPTFKWIKVSKKCDIPIEFSGTTGNIAEIRSANIGVMVLSLAGAANVTIGYTARVRFVDT